MGRETGRTVGDVLLARGALVGLADAGRAAIEQAAPAHVRAVRALVFDPVGAEDAAVLDKILGRLLDALESAEIAET